MSTAKQIIRIHMCIRIHIRIRIHTRIAYIHTYVHAFVHTYIITITPIAEALIKKHNKNYQQINATQKKK